MAFTVVAIDVGLLNLGLVEARVTEDYTLETIVYAERIDITVLKHTAVSRQDCTLHHTSDAVDRVLHFVQEHQTLLTRARNILVERQPIMGLVHVEQLLYHLYRDKTILCSPNQMHRHFGLPRGDRLRRKELTVKLAEPSLCHLDMWKSQADRLHDVADAVCILLWWLSLRHADVLRQQRRQIFVDGQPHSVDAFFDQFRFVDTSINQS